MLVVDYSFLFGLIEAVYNRVLAFDNVDCGNVDAGISIEEDFAYLV